MKENLQIHKEIVDAVVMKNVGLAEDLVEKDILLAVDTIISDYRIKNNFEIK